MFFLLIGNIAKRMRHTEIWNTEKQRARTTEPVNTTNETYMQSNVLCNMLLNPYLNTSITQIANIKYRNVCEYDYDISFIVYTLDQQKQCQCLCLPHTSRNIE